MRISKSRWLSTGSSNMFSLIKSNNASDENFKVTLVVHRLVKYVLANQIEQCKWWEFQGHAGCPPARQRFYSYDVAVDCIEDQLLGIRAPFNQVSISLCNDANPLADLTGGIWHRRQIMPKPLTETKHKAYLWYIKHTMQDQGGSAVGLLSWEVTSLSFFYVLSQPSCSPSDSWRTTSVGDVLFQIVPIC